MGADHVDLLKSEASVEVGREKLKIHYALRISAAGLMWVISAHQSEQLLSLIDQRPYKDLDESLIG